MLRPRPWRLRFAAFPLLAVSPVQPTQRVQDRTTDFILGIGLKLHIVPSVEAVDGRDQTHYPGNLELCVPEVGLQPLEAAV
jgi:hypothetical protein